jgi:uncharacterized membrane protein YhdT
MTTEEIYRQVKKEAEATGLLLVVLILFWIAAGFGLSGAEGRIFGLPLWVVCGTVGVWVFAILAVALLVHFVFRDVPLSAEDEALEPPEDPRGTAPSETKGGGRA